MRPFFVPLPAAALVAFCCVGFMTDAQATSDGPTIVTFTPAVISAHGGTTTLYFAADDTFGGRSGALRMMMPNGLAAPLDGNGNIIFTKSSGCSNSTNVVGSGVGIIQLTGVIGSLGGGCEIRVVLTATQLFNYDSANDSWWKVTDGGVFYHPQATLRAVANAPTTSAAFAPSSISFHGFSNLTVTLSNPDPDYALSGFGLTIPLPSGLGIIVSNNGCGGTDLGAGGTTLGFSGSSLAVGASCTYSATVQGTGAGTKNVSAQIAANEIQTVTKTPALVVTPATTVTALATACMTTFVDAAPAQPFSLTAAVDGIAPTGSVTFSDSVAGVLCGGSVALDENGAAACTTNALAAGVHQISASYGPDANHTASTSASIAVTVLDANDALFRNDFEGAVTGCPIE